MIKVGSRVGHSLTGDLGTVACYHEFSDSYQIAWDKLGILHSIIRPFNIFEVVPVARASQQRRFKNTHCAKESAHWINLMVKRSIEHKPLTPSFGEPTYD